MAVHSYYSLYILRGHSKFQFNTKYNSTKCTLPFFLYLLILVHLLPKTYCHLHKLNHQKQKHSQWQWKWNWLVLFCHSCSYFSWLASFCKTSNGNKTIFFQLIRQTDRQTDRRTDGWTDIHTYRQTEIRKEAKTIVDSFKWDVHSFVKNL